MRSRVYVKGLRSVSLLHRSTAARALRASIVQPALSSKMRAVSRWQPAEEAEQRLATAEMVICSVHHCNEQSHTFEFRLCGFSATADSFSIFLVTFSTASAPSSADTHCSEKRRPTPFYFLNNSVKNQPILMIFGTLNPEKIWHENLTDLSTSPVICT